MKVRFFELLTMEDRSRGMESGKLYWVIFKGYYKKPWVTYSGWVLGQNEKECREKASKIWSK